MVTFSGELLLRWSGHFYLRIADLDGNERSEALNTAAH